MVEPRGEPDFTQESLRFQRAAGFGVQHLERDQPVVLEIAGQVDGGHPAPPELALKLVAVTECLSQHIRLNGHGNLRMRRLQSICWHCRRVAIVRASR